MVSTRAAIIIKEGRDQITVESQHLNRYYDDCLDSAAAPHGCQMGIRN